MIAAGPGMAESTRIAIIGVTGRMGQALLRAFSEFPGLRVTGAVASHLSSWLGRDVGELSGTKRVGIRVTADLAGALALADVAIDFSHHAVTRANLEACRTARKPLVICTTGFGPELAPALEGAAREIPLLLAPNTSLGVTVLMELVRAAAKALPAEFDIEIVEAHHRLKVDAPSGTALALGRAVTQGRTTAPHAGTATRAVAMGRAFDSGTRTRAGVRCDNEIGYAVVRGGDIVGQHTVLFVGQGEQLILEHRATDRILFARGALRAALWLANQPVGHYAMRDVLNC